MTNAVADSPAIKGKRLRTTEEASEYFRIVWGFRRTKATMTTDRCLGRGCPFRKIGSNVYYEEGDQDAYAQALIGEPLASTAQYRHRQAEEAAATP